MIRTGILTDNHPDLEPVRGMTRFKELMISSVDNQHPENACPTSANEVIQSSDMLYVDLSAFPAEQVRLAFRNSTHLFFRRIPSLRIDEITALIHLETEAGCKTQIFLPQLFLPENLDLISRLQLPLLVNVRLKANAGEELEGQLQTALIILALLDKSSLKKIDVNTLEGGQDAYVMDIRIARSSGSVARFILSTHFRDDQSVVELFQAGKPIIPVPVMPLIRSGKQLSEQTAIRELIKAIKGEPAVLVSLHELLQARQIMQKINEKLKYLGSSLTAVNQGS
ncbi:MAG: hypothetical protein PHI28_11720 [Mangrovibacterium sp.]|nr:hypothetical protein [Mangrovibacterium sp.]